MADRRLKRDEKSLAYDIRRLENLIGKYASLERQREKQKGRFKKKVGALENQMEKIDERMKNHKGDENKLRERWKKKARKVGQLEGSNQKKVSIIDEREGTLNKLKKQILESVEQDKKDVARWKKKLKDTPFYEIDTEMDHIMTNFKILLENSLLFAKDTFFEGKVGMGMLINQFINHYGDLHILDRGNRFRFKLNKFDGKEMMKKARKACEIFNDMKIRTADGILLEITMKR